MSQDIDKTPVSWVLTAYFAIALAFVFIAQTSDVMYKIWVLVMQR